MTREEAIDILKAIQALICPNKESVLENNFSEAFDMAIEALQAPTDGDIIRREDAVNALLEKGQHSRRYRVGEVWELNFTEIRETLADVPSADSVSTEYAIECIDQCRERKNREITIIRERKNREIAELKKQLADRPTRGRKDATEEDYHYCDDCEAVEMCMWYPYRECQFKVSRLTGEWEFDNDIPDGQGGFYAGYKCSVCGAVFWHLDWHVDRKNYCPNCGADMRGDNNETD